MVFTRASLLFISVLSVNPLYASQNVFAPHSPPPMVEAVPADMDAAPEADSDVVLPANVPVPETKPVLENDPLHVILRYSGTDWKRRTAKDYGLEDRYRMSVKPTWETKTPKPYSHMGTSYTQYAAFIIDHFGLNLINGPHEFTGRNTVCPKYNTLSREKKIEFWVHFTSAFAFYESGYNPKTRFRESSQGVDKVTREHTYSEGMLQLSYKDMSSYKVCRDVFNWEHDKNISRTADTKTIFDPMRNMYCGLRILNQIAGSRKSIFFDKSHYWAVLKPNGRYGKVGQITDEVRKQTPFCR